MAGTVPAPPETIEVEELTVSCNGGGGRRIRMNCSVCDGCGDNDGGGLGTAYKPFLGGGVVDALCDDGVDGGGGTPILPSFGSQ